MSAAGKLLLISGVARSLYGRWRLRRLLADVVVMSGLAVFLGILLSACTLVVIYAGYLSLMYRGADPILALYFIALILISIILLLGVFIRLRLRVWLHAAPQTPRAESALDAFIDGLLEE